MPSMERTMTRQLGEKIAAPGPLVPQAKQPADRPTESCFRPDSGKDDKATSPRHSALSDLTTRSFDVDMDSTRAPTTRPRFGTFLLGILSSAAGIGIVLSIAFGLVQPRQVAGDFSTLLLGGLMIFSVLLIGSGFGIMVLSAAVFDHQEFDRLAQAGNLAAVDISTTSASGLPESMGRNEFLNQEPALTASPGTDSAHSNRS